jgi:hypothetical protein
MNTLTFNPSNWGDTQEVTATVLDLTYGDKTIMYRGEQFEFSRYSTNFGDPENGTYEICDLSHEGQLVATASKDDWTNFWYAVEHEGSLEREDHNPIVALLQVASNIM